MKKAIKQKLMNLVSLNPHDSTILTKLSSQKHINLFKYIKKEDLISFINNETSFIELDANRNSVAFEQQLKSASNFGEFCSVLNNYNVSLPDNKLNQLERSFENNKKKISLLALEQLLAFRKKFISLNRLARNHFEDTTVWPLYFAFNFIKGKVHPNQSFKSPLTLFKVEIREEAGKIFITKIQDEPVVNEKIQIFFKAAYKDFKTETTELLSKTDLESNIKAIKDITGQDVLFSNDEFVSFINEGEIEILEKYSQFEIEPSALLGLFEPDGGKLKDDLQKIIDLDVDPFESEQNNNNKSTEYYEEKVIKEQPVIEIGRPLNIFQKYAVASSLAQNTLIYGPPGTGKSEVIANIIFNVLLKGKTSLLVSEKRAALDVLTDRIGSLSLFALYTYDLENKEAFFSKIDKLNELLGTQWYREQSRSSKSKDIEPIKLTPEESMFINNYEVLNNELLKLVRKNWKIEDFEDGIYSMNYADYVAVKEELGEQIVKEWLSPKAVYEDDKQTTIYDEITKVFNEYSFARIDDFFDAYNKFYKFVKKHRLTDKYSHSEILKHLKMVITKIQNNEELVTKYLMHEKKVRHEIEKYHTFMNEQSFGVDQTFSNKSVREKKIFIDKISNYLKFRSEVIERDFSLQNKKPEELEKIISVVETFFNDHKRFLQKNEWYDFLIENKDKIPAFLNAYNRAQEQSHKDIIFAEFIINSSVINSSEPENESNLSLKEIKSKAKESQEFLSLFGDFMENIEFLSKNRIKEIVLYREFIYQDINILQKLNELSEIYTPIMQEFIKEWAWLSLPYIKELYLKPILLFDQDKLGPVMRLLTAPITDEQYRDLRKVIIWDEIVKVVPMFSENEGKLLQDIIWQLRRESQLSAKHIEEIVYRRYVNNLRNHLTKLPQSEKDEITNALRIASSKPWPSISRYVEKYYNALKRLFPIWVARPDNVASLIPLNENEFDYGIFDEASQMTIERSYPVVYRCRIKVVSGDDKQLKPTSFFVNKMANAEFELDDFDRVDSLLERAKTSWWNEFHLRNHYRSDSKELIEFSNKFIYDNKLEIATKQGAFEKGIEVINVNGVWEKGNQIEAQQAVATLIDNWKKYEKILIVTFNAVQATLVENLILESMSNFEQGLVDKIDNNDIVITNLENVQGNEGDLVILSIAYGPNPEGTIRNNFGPLNAKGGANRLNVAITRARKKMIVIKSLYGSQIQVANVNNQNAMTFKKFVEYIDQVDSRISINEQLEGVENQQYLEFDNDLIKEIYSELTKKIPSKFQLFPNWNIGTKKIDLVIIEKETRKIVKTVLVETWKANRNVQIMFEDIDRQNFLEDRGYSTYRIKEYEWYTQKARIVSRIKESLNPNSRASKGDYYVVWQEENK